MSNLGELFEEKIIEKLKAEHVETIKRGFKYGASLELMTKTFSKRFSEEEVKAIYEEVKGNKDE